MSKKDQLAAKTNAATSTMLRSATGLWPSPDSASSFTAPLSIYPTPRGIRKRRRTKEIKKRKMARRRFFRPPR